MDRERRVGMPEPFGDDFDRGAARDERAGVRVAEVVKLAPVLTNVTTAEVYVAGSTIVDLEAIARAIGLRPIDGGRLTLRPFPTATTDWLAAVTEDMRMAPWPRVYADLLGAGVRGEDAAEHLKEIVRGR